MIRFVQLQHRTTGQRRLALVEEPRLVPLADYSSLYDLAQASLASGKGLGALAAQAKKGKALDYDSIYQQESEWRFLPPMDHPREPSRCLVTGTGLTHLGSAKNRQSMHTAKIEELTDSMKMFQWGVEGGRPAPGLIGTPPEWFYKGTGSILRAHGEALEAPSYAEDGGEEAEVAGIYVIDSSGKPCRVGFAIGNEYSDHRFEKKNYLNLAGSKLRNCALGPEVVIDAPFQSVPGEVRLERGGNLIWSKVICTGEAEMCHSLQNIEHHHFKFEGHRRPGDVHIHYFGAHSLSFGDGVQLEDGDVMVIHFEGMGRSLRNQLSVSREPKTHITVQPLA
jgi:hypothetical protein